MMRAIDFFIAYLFIFFKALLLIHASHVNKHIKHEVYKVEHEISSTQAKNNALTMDLNEMVSPAGCQPCSNSELSYCYSPSIINDHCCCEKRFKESFPFIPHTCFIGDKLCKPVLNCDDYTRLRRCCCHKLLLAKWKNISSASSHGGGYRYSCITVVILYIVNMYL